MHYYRFKATHNPTGDAVIMADYTCSGSSCAQLCKDLSEVPEQVPF